MKIPDNKTSTPRSFTIEGKMRQIVQKYATLRSPKTTSKQFFVNYQREKCTTQVIGTHTFVKMPKQIAEFLNLENVELYTGHVFRRTSATLLADAGTEISLLKRHGAWKSSTVAEGSIFYYEYFFKKLSPKNLLSVGYVEDSVANKIKRGSMIGKEIRDSTLKNGDEIEQKKEKVSSPPRKVAKATNIVIQPHEGTFGDSFIDESNWDDIEIEQNVMTIENRPIINIHNCTFNFN